MISNGFCVLRLKPSDVVKGVTLLASLVGLSLHLYHVINSYFEYRFTESTFERRGPMQFPDVSICNMRGLSSSNFEAAAETSHKVKAIMKDLNNSKSETEQILYLRDYVAFAEEEGKLMGHRREDMMVSCFFRKQPCKQDDFEHFLFPSFVNCYTFSRGRNTFVTSKGSLDTGLRIEVYLEPENSSFSSIYGHRTVFSYQTGIKVLLAPPNHLPSIGFSAYEAAPGLSTSMTFETTEHTRLPEPYNQCRHTTKTTGESDVPYSFVECRNDCIHADVTSECGCRSTGYLVRNPANISSCGKYLLTNKTMSDDLLECQAKVYKRSQQTPNYFNDKCQCFWPCSDTQYSVTMSQSPWPAKSSWKSFLSETLESNPSQKEGKAYKYYQFLKSSNASEDQIYSWISHHFLRLDIFARTDLVLVKQEIPKYTLTDLLSSIGGSLGLWVGVSVLTLSKLIDHIFGANDLEKEKVTRS